MALRKRDGIYIGDWYFGGKRIRRSSGTTSLRKAKEWHHKTETELWRQFKLGEKRRTWDDAVVGYMKSRQEKSSYDQDISRLNWLHPYLGGKDLSKINADLLTQTRDDRLEQVKGSTVNRMMSLVGAILHHAEDREWIARAPRIPKAEATLATPAWLTPDEVKKLIKELSKPRTKHQVAFVAFAIATGLRMRNITHLKWSQIDMQRKVLWVEASQSKNRTPISIPLVDDAVAILRDQIGKDLIRVFTCRGKPYDRVGIRSLNAAARRAGIDKHIHPHLFRHTFASWHIMSGTSIYDLMKLGGWKKIESVLIYAHLSAEHLHAAAANRATIEDVFDDAIRMLTDK
jgi:integrase